MPALSTELRSIFEKQIIQARETAEGAAGTALTTYVVELDRPFETMSGEQRMLRRALRARARQLGEGEMNVGMPLLVEEIAYEQWHRMLFARFLAENELLMHPEGVAVTLEECAELAQEEGAEDLWAVATRYASRMLPGIFRVDDPALLVRFAPEGRHKLEQIVSELPRAIFTSDDGLGWAYQFWQTQKKKEVNDSERKIGGADVAPVTQLFTEDYMVKFLLHNTLGAWWAHRHPASPLNKTFEYLRYRKDGARDGARVPAAGTFDGWPEKVAEVTMLDPCGGSGHFVVAAFEMFTQMRMEGEGLSAAAAGDAVIRDNVHMLELDLRCTQIAAFNLALAAWKSGGYRVLPQSKIACSGVPVKGQLETWLALADKDDDLQRLLKRLHRLFRDAPYLGSLINPRDVALEEQLFLRNYDVAIEKLNSLLETPNIQDTPAKLAENALDLVRKAARILANEYTFVATNVPFLNFSKFNPTLKSFCETKHPRAKRDLATVFIERCKAFTEVAGTYSLVTPQNWLFLGSYKGLRRHLLHEQAWNHCNWLGPGAFGSISGEVVKPSLLILTNELPAFEHSLTTLDVANCETPDSKSYSLKNFGLSVVIQGGYLSNPDARVTAVPLDMSKTLLAEYADSYEGIGSGDLARFSKFIWELPSIDDDWQVLRGTCQGTESNSGITSILYWEDGRGDIYELAQALRYRLKNTWKRGDQAWGSDGVAVNRMGDLFAEGYYGEIFDSNIAAIIPKRPEFLEPIWYFVRSRSFREAVRKVDKSIKVTNKTFLKVPFDLDEWNAIAKQNGPIPSPYSLDPTQWYFNVKPQISEKPLQVTIVLLLGYQWPIKQDDELVQLGDEDGIVCFPSVVGEPPAAERLQVVLASAFGEEWSLTKQRKLLEDIGFKGKGLDVWLRDGFFKQHCKLFKNRPFIWHIWDGWKDGFSALVNYHKLDHARLERLIYTYLGDWINTQRAEQEQGVAGADGRLVAALELKKKLELILEGEPPFDIYVRWKPLHEQPIGWNPDLNDGVRLNIRPFITAGVLRSKFTIHWKKDRGKNPDGSERINDRHITREKKEEARRKAGVL